MKVYGLFKRLFEPIRDEVINDSACYMCRGTSLLSWYYPAILGYGLSILYRKDEDLRDKLIEEPQDIIRESVLVGLGIIPIRNLIYDGDCSFQHCPNSMCDPTFLPRNAVAWGVFRA